MRHFEPFAFIFTMRLVVVTTMIASPVLQCSSLLSVVGVFRLQWCLAVLLQDLRLLRITQACVLLYAFLHAILDILLSVARQDEGHDDRLNPLWMGLSVLSSPGTPSCARCCTPRCRTESFAVASCRLQVMRDPVCRA